MGTFPLKRKKNYQKLRTWLFSKMNSLYNEEWQLPKSWTPNFRIPKKNGSKISKNTKKSTLSKLRTGPVKTYQDCHDSTDLEKTVEKINSIPSGPFENALQKMP